MKKVITLIISIILIVTLASCNGTETSSTSTNESYTSSSIDNDSSSTEEGKTNSVIDEKMDQTLSTNKTTQFKITSKSGDVTEEMGMLEISFDNYAAFKNDGLLSHINIYIKGQDSKSFMYFDGSTFYNSTNLEHKYKVENLDTINIKYLLNNTSVSALSLLDMSNESMFTVDAVSQTSIRLLPAEKMSMLMPDLKNIVMSMGDNSLISNITLNLEHMNDDMETEEEEISLSMTAVEKTIMSIDATTFTTEVMPYNVDPQLMIDSMVLFNRNAAALSYLDSGVEGEMNLNVSASIFNPIDTSTYKVGVNFSVFLDTVQMKTDQAEMKDNTGMDDSENPDYGKEYESGINLLDYVKFNIVASIDNQLANLVISYLNSSEDFTMDLSSFTPDNLKLHLFYLGNGELTIYLLNGGVNIYTQVIPFDINEYSDILGGLLDEDDEYDPDYNTKYSNNFIKSLYDDTDYSDESIDILSMLGDALPYLDSTVTDTYVSFYLTGNIFDEINASLASANSYLNMSLPNISKIEFKSTFINNLPKMTLSVSTNSMDIITLTIMITGSSSLESFSSVQSEFEATLPS